MAWAMRQAWKLSVVARGRPILGNLSQLRAAERLAEPELMELQREKLRRLLLHAYQNTRYYRRVLETNKVVTSDGTVHLDRLGDVPLLDKPLLRREFENMTSADLHRRKWYTNTSGGSTGEPARFIQDSYYEGWADATKLYFDAWTGYQMCDRKVILWGSARDIDGGRSPFRTRLARWVRNERWLRAFLLTETDMVAHAEVINRFRPVQLLAYVESAYELARAIGRLGIEMHRPRAIVTSAGTLHPTIRDTIERAFGAPVYNQYGARELSGIASECDRHLGLHVNVPCHYVEILRPDGGRADPGEEGELVVTCLTNYAMPLIRYRIQDTALWAAEPCTCGRKSPLLAQVTGRLCDTMVTKDGAQVGGEYFTRGFRTQEWLQRYRIVQEAVDRVDVFLQPVDPVGNADPTQLDSIRVMVKRVMGADCTVTIQVVPEIEPMPSGKHLCVISKVNSLNGARG